MCKCDHSSTFSAFGAFEKSGTNRKPRSIAIVFTYAIILYYYNIFSYYMCGKKWYICLICDIKINQECLWNFKKKREEIFTLIFARHRQFRYAPDWIYLEFSNILFIHRIDNLCKLYFVRVFYHHVFHLLYIWSASSKRYAL